MACLPILEIRILEHKWKQPLADFFHSLKQVGDDKFFHPHPMTVEEAEKRCQYNWKDLYYICVEGERILGYEILRGWDEGYKIPSLVIAIHSSVKGTGLGKVLMHFLHAAARRRGVKRIRLKVHPDNLIAVKFYEEIDYKFQVAKEDGKRVGFLDF